MLTLKNWKKYHALSDDGKFALARKYAELLHELHAGLDLIALDLEKSRPELMALLSSSDIGKKLDRLLDGIHQMSDSAGVQDD